MEAGTGGAGAPSTTLELIPDGNDVEVIEGNREEYVRAYIETRLRCAVSYSYLLICWYQSNKD